MMDRVDFYVASIFAAVFAACLTGAYVFNSTKCERRAEMLGLGHNYGIMTGCMVKVGKRYAPIEYIRIVDDQIIIQGDGE